MKNASKETSARSAADSATVEMGVNTVSNLASCTFFSITRLAPFSRTTRSSFGRLNAAVCTPRFASPAANTTFTTRIGASAPSVGFRYRGSIGSASSRPCSWSPNRATVAVPASLRTVTKASKAAL